MSDREGQAIDPFGETTDPAVYVARPASEAALEALARAVVDLRLPALVGPPGIGKTLLLHRCADRMERRGRWTPIYLPYASLGPDELCRWILGPLGVAPGDSPREALLDHAKATKAGGTRLLVCLDEASGLRRETGECLAGLVWQSGGGVSVVMAATDDAPASRALSTLGPDLEPIRFTRPLSLDETRQYIAGRLAQRSAPQPVRERFDACAIGWIHRLSGGIPRRIHEVASLLIEAPPERVSPAWWKECGAEWLERHAELEGDARTALRPLLLDDLPDLEEPELWVAEDEEFDDLQSEGDVD